MGPKQLLGSIGAPGLCAKQTNIWTTERPAWGWADLQGPPLSGGWNHSLIPFHYSSPPPAPSLLPIHSLRIYPAASLTLHVSGQMSKNAPFNDTQQQEQEKKKPSTSIQSSLLWLARPLPPGFSQLMIDNVLLSLTLGLHMPFYWTTQPLWGNLGAQPLGPGTPLGSFEREKKKGQKGPWVGAGPTGTKQPESWMGWAFVPAPGPGSRERMGSPVRKSFWSDSLPFFFFCLSKKGNYTETPTDQVYFETVKSMLPELSFLILWLPLKFLERTSHFQLHSVTKRFN